MKLFAFSHKSESHGTFYVIAESVSEAYEFVRAHRLDVYRPDWWSLEDQWEKGQVVEDVE